MANWPLSPPHGLDYSLDSDGTQTPHNLLNTIMPFTPHLQFTIIHLYAILIFALLIWCYLYFTGSLFWLCFFKSRRHADYQMEQNAGAFVQVLELKKLCSQSKIYPSDTCITQPTKVQTELDFTGIIPRAQNYLNAHPKGLHKMGIERKVMSYQGQHQHKSHFHHWSPRSHCPRRRPSGLGYICRWCTYTGH